MAALSDVGAAGLAVGQAETAADVRSAAGAQDSASLAQLVPLDSNDRVRLLLDEASGSLANSGGAGGSWTAGSGLVYGEKVFLSGGVRVGSGIDGLAGSNAVEPTTLTLWAWLRLRSGALGDEGVILGKPHPASASPTWADPYWSVRLGVNSSRQIIASRVKTADPIWPSRLETLSFALTARTDYLVGLTYDGSRLSIWVDGDEVAAATNGGTIAYGTAGVTPWVAGYVWSGGGYDRHDSYVGALGICDVARPSSWWREMYRRGMGRYR